MKQKIVLGTPITPIKFLKQLGGSSFCVSYFNASKVNISEVVRLVGVDDILLLDNGAYSFFRSRQTSPDSQYWDNYMRWAGSLMNMVPEAVAIVPDEIDGQWQENRAWAVEYSLNFDPARLMVVWHLNDPLELLEDYLEMGFGYLGMGSTSEFGGANSPVLHNRLRQAFKVIDRVCADGNGYRRPWLHLLRHQSIAHMYPFQSSDSCNIAINHSKHRTTENHLHLLVHRLKQKCANVDWPCDQMPRNKAFEVARVEKELALIKRPDNHSVVREALKGIEICLANEVRSIAPELECSDFKLVSG